MGHFSERPHGCSIIAGMSAPQLSPHDIRRAAVTAHLDDRTIVKFLRGGRQHCTTRARIEHALRSLGLAPREPAPPASSPIPETA